MKLLSATIIALSIWAWGVEPATAQSPPVIPHTKKLPEAPAAPGTLSPILPTRVMCIGDSNTHGVNGHTSYRYPLWSLLNPIQSRIEFVGTQYTVDQEDGVTIPDLGLYPDYYTRFDRDHQSYTGIRSDQIAPLLGIASDLVRPDLCIVMIGTNDIGQMGAAGVAHTQTGIAEIVRDIRQQAPTTTFLVTSLPPIGPGTSFFFQAAHIDTFNTQLPAFLTSLDLPLSPVVFVDINAALDVNIDMQSDGLHPNPQGQAKIAAVLFPWLIKEIRGDFRPATNPLVMFFDGGFESLGLADDQYSQMPLADWTYHVEPNVNTGVWNPDEVSYPGALGNGSPLGADGAEVLALENVGGDPTLAWVYQTLSTTLEKNTSYTLEVGVGLRAPGGSRGFATFGGYEIQLLAGNAIVAGSMNQVTPMPGSFATDTILVDSNSLDASLYGQPLTIRVRHTYAQFGVATDIDAIQLTAQ